MDVTALTISLSTVLAIFGAVIAWQNYKLNKQKASRKETEEEAEKRRLEEERQKQNEIRLVAIEKDVQYIRLNVDKVIETQEHHGEMLQKHEKELAALRAERRSRK